MDEVGRTEPGEPTIANPLSETEGAELLAAVSIEPWHSMVRRLLFERDRLRSAIEGKDGWKDIVQGLRSDLGKTYRILEKCLEYLHGQDDPAAADLLEEIG